MTGRGLVAVATAVLAVLGGVAPSAVAAPSDGLTELRGAVGKPAHEVLAVIRRSEWRPAAKQAPFGGHTGPDGRIHLTFAPQHADLAATVKSYCHLEGLIGCVEGTGDLIVMSKPNVVVAFVGDSGGPVYTRTGTTGAIANGMIVAGDVIRDAFGNVHPKPGGLVYAEKISNIQFNFNAQVATTP